MKRYQIWTAALAISLSACGKKDSPPEPTPVEQVEQIGQVEAPDEGQAPVDSGEAAQAQDRRAPEAPPKAGDSQALSTATIAVFPEDIIAVAGIPSTSTFLTAAFDLAKAAGFGALAPDDPIAFFHEQVKGLGLDLSWMDVNAPIRLIVPNPKKNPDEAFIILPIAADQAEAAGAFGGSGKTFKVSGAGLEFYGSRQLDGYIVLASQEKALTPFADFAQSVTKWTPVNHFTVEASATNLSRIYADELKQAQQELGSIGGALGNTADIAQLLNFAEDGFALIQGATKVGYAADLSGLYPRQVFTYQAQEGSDLHKYIVDAKRGGTAFLGAIPENAWFALALAAGPEKTAESLRKDLALVTDSLKESFAEIPGLKVSPEDYDKLTDMLVTYAVENQGPSSLWIAREGGNPLVMGTAVKLNDGAKAVAQFHELFNFLYQLVWPTVGGQVMGDEAKNVSFGDILTLAGTQSALFGVKLKVYDGKDKDLAGLYGLDTTINWNKLPPPILEEAAPVKAIIGDHLGMAYQGKGDTLAYYFGPKADAGLKSIFDNKDKATTNTWLKEGTDKAGVAFFRPVPLLESLAGIIPDVAEYEEQIKKLSDEPVLFYSDTDGETFSAELRLPIKLIGDIAKLAAMPVLDDE